MDDFIEHFNKDLMTGSCQPHKWIVYPSVTDSMKKIVNQRHKEYLERGNEG